MREDIYSDHSISSTVVQDLCCNCRRKLKRRRFSFTKILRIVIITAIVFFFMAIPMGDPNHNCKENKLNLCCNLTALTSTYYALIKAFYVAVTTFEVIMCYVLDSLYKAKLLVYDILAKIDRKDLCQSACEQEKIVLICKNPKVRNKVKYTKIPVLNDDINWQ